MAVTPILRGDPGYDFLAITQFLLGVFVVELPFTVPGAGYIDSNAGILRFSKHHVCCFISRRRSVAFAIGQIFQNGRYGARFG